ncbi:MAG: phosphotransferase [Planctomycetes bacterium]|nr:phosphotransferase [Planctomycetota bacterium]
MSWNWTVAPGAEALARALAGSEDEWFPPDLAAVVRENSVRTLFRRDGLFCKFFKKRPDQAESEWKALRHLSAAGIPVPRPVAWARAPGGGAVLATAEVAGAVPLKAAYRRELLPAVAALLRRMHGAGYLHRDLHLGNLLVAGDAVWVIDVHRGRIGPVGPRDEERALGQLAYSLSRTGTVTDVRRLLAAYRPDADHAWVERILRHADAFRRAHLASRTRRCLKDSSGFQVAREADGLWLVKRPASLAEARALLARHDALCGEGKAVKALDARRITNAGGFYVKEWRTSGPFRALRNWIRGTPARAAWIAANGMRVRNLPAPEGVALAELRGRSVFLAREAAGKPLDRYCREDVPRLRDRRPFLDALASAVRRLHFRDTHHRDLKANNILADGPMRFAFLDLEDVEFRRVRRADAVKALAQLNAALPLLTRADRWRMLRRYAAGFPLLGDLRAAAREIMRLTVRRRHNWPGGGPAK